MRYVAAYLLAVLGGNKNPGNDDIVKILSSVGIEADKEKLAVVVKELSGKNVTDLIQQGRVKLSSMPSGGGAVAVTAAAGGAPAAGGKEAAKEEKKEEPKKVEAEPESDEDMGFGLFD